MAMKHILIFAYAFLTRILWGGVGGRLRGSKRTWQRENKNKKSSLERKDRDKGDTEGKKEPAEHMLVAKKSSSHAWLKLAITGNSLCKYASQ